MLLLSSGPNTKCIGPILHLDYLHWDKSSIPDNQVLELKDDIHWYCWIQLAENENAEVSAVQLGLQNRAFTAPWIWISDKAPHFISFKYNVHASDYRSLPVPAVAYSPCANGTVKYFDAYSTAAFCSIFLKMKQAPQDWRVNIQANLFDCNKPSLQNIGCKNDKTLCSPLQDRSCISPIFLISLILPNKPDSILSHILLEIHAQQLLKIVNECSAYYKYEELNEYITAVGAFWIVPWH